MAALYRKEEEPPQGDAFGQALAAAAAAAPATELWPENWAVFRLFTRLSTQWRVGMGGPTGLCYEAVYPLIDRMGLSDEEWDQVFDDVMCMERAALDAMRE